MLLHVGTFWSLHKTNSAASRTHVRINYRVRFCLSDKLINVLVLIELARHLTGKELTFRLSERVVLFMMMSNKVSISSQLIPSVRYGI